MKRFQFKNDILITLMILSLPFAFYLYLLAPSDVKTWEIGGFKITTDYFLRIRYFLWINAYKILTILLLSIWFVTCKFWWRFFIVIPILVQLCAYVYFLSSEFKFSQNLLILYTLILSTLWITILILLSQSLMYYSKQKKFKDELNKEIYYLTKQLSSRKKVNVNELKNEFEELKFSKENLSKKTYLTKLYELKDRISH